MLRRIIAGFVIVVSLLIGSVPAAHSATLLPNGEQTFLDTNGNPLANGKVYMYIPNTTTFKQTWQNSIQTILNTNPIILNAAGRAIIYGSGVYRQLVLDVNGNTIWDQLTTDTSSTQASWCGTSTGTPNAIITTCPNFTLTDGQVISFIAGNTNTGATTDNSNSLGAIPIVRDSASGPQTLTGGEIVASNIVSLLYDATAGTFHIISPVTWPSTSGVSVGAIIPQGGFTVPNSNYAFAYGQAVSRSTFSSLFAVYTSTQTGTLSSGSPIITALSDTTQFGYGQAVEGVGIPAGATVISTTSTTVTLSANATLSRTGSVTFFAYGNGDGVNTFNLPDMRGRTFVGRDNMGGTAGNVSQYATTISTTSASNSATVASASNLSVGMAVISANVPPGTTISTLSGTTVTLSGNASATASNVAARFSLFPDAQSISSKAGSTTYTMLAAQMPTHSHGVTDPQHSHTTVATTSNTAGTGGATNGALITSSGAGLATALASTGVTINNSGSSQPMPTLMPAIVTNYVVRIVP